MSTDESSLSEELSVLKDPPGRDIFAQALEGKLIEAEMSASAPGSSVNVVAFPLRKAALLLSAAVVLIGGGAFAYLASQAKEPPPKIVAPELDVPVVKAPSAPKESREEESEVEPQPEVSDAAPPPTNFSTAPRHRETKTEPKKLKVELAVPQLKERETKASEGKLKPLGDVTHSVNGEQPGNERKSIRRPGETRE